MMDLKPSNLKSLAAWQALDSLITSLDEREALDLVVEDEDGAALLAYIYSALGGLSLSEDEFQAEVESFLSFLSRYVHGGLREWSGNGKPADFRGHVRELVKAREGMDSVFTADECVELVSAVSAKRDFELCLLDQVLGLYYCAKVLEEQLPNYSVEEIFYLFSLEKEIRKQNGI